MKSLRSSFPDHLPGHDFYKGCRDEAWRLQEYMLKHINAYGFPSLVFFVTASGFYSASYSLFATNAISPALAYLYWPKSENGIPGFGIDIVTLIASLFGMVLFGHAADRWGRKFLYGVELIIVIIGTLSLAQASTGYDNSMKIQGWIYFWRIVLGFGIGAEYPVTAIIAAEWTPTHLRGRMMMSVFLMQSLGQLSASAVAYGAATHLGKVCKDLSYGKCDIERAGHAVDQFWRTVIGVGAAPALLAILLRFAMRESARWNLEVFGDRSKRDRQESEEDREMGNINAAQSGTVGSNPSFTNALPRPNNPAATNTSAAANGNPLAHAESTEQDESPEDSELSIGRRNTGGSGTATNQFKFFEFKEYLYTGGAWKPLLGISLCWFFQDICYYGLGLNNPRIISKLWKHITPPLKRLKDWETDLVSPGTATIFEVLWRNSARNMITISTGSVTGSLVMIWLINFVPRVRFMALTFGILAGFFAIIGGALFSHHVYEAEHYAFTIFMYAIVQFLFNIGPNALTWILPAEMFQTRYRGTLYGMAAASGKLGAILVQGVLKAAKVSKPEAPHWKLSTIMFCFAAVMMVGAFTAQYLIPEVQILSSQIEDVRRRILAPRDQRKYPIFGNYSNVVLETIVKEIDERETGGANRRTT